MKEILEIFAAWGISLASMFGFSYKYLSVEAMALGLFISIVLFTWTALQCWMNRKSRSKTNET